MESKKFIKALKEKNIEDKNILYKFLIINGGIICLLE